MPLNILHLATHLNIGGITSYVTLLAVAQKKRGHRVSVLCSGGDLVEDLRNSEIQTHQYPIRTKNELHPKLYFHLVGILRLVQKERFDVIHAHSRVTQVLASVVSKATRTPYVSTAHGFFKPKLGRRLLPAWGDRVIAISPLVAEELKKSHGVSGHRIDIVPNALDVADWEKRLESVEASAARAQYQIAPESRLVACISRLVEDKGQAYLVEAARILAREFPSLCLCIVGDGREKEALQKRAQDIPQVRFFPSLKDVAPLLKITDVFVHPATFREGFGLSVAEAMVAKIPVVVTDIPAINAIVQDKVTGLVVPPKSAEALAEAIARLLRDPALAKALGHAGYRMASQVCSLERQVGEIEEVYRRAMSRYEKA